MVTWSTRSRVALSATDQMIASASNALVAFLVARSASVSSLGAFTLAFALYSLLLGLSRALISEPLALRHHAGALEHASGAMSAAAIIGTVSGGLAAGLCLLLSAAPVVLGAVLVIAGFLPLLLVQDAARAIWLVNDKPLGAVVNDMGWLIAAVILLQGFALAGAGASQAIAGWAMPGALAGLTALVAHRSHFDFRAGICWFREHRAMYSALVSEQVLMSASRPLVLWSSGALAGLTVPAALHAAQVLYAPVIALQVTVPYVAYLEAVRARHGGRSVIRVASVVGAAGVAITIGWMVVLALAGEPLLIRVFGRGHDLAAPILVPTGIMLVATSVNLGSITLLRGLGALRSSARVRVVSAVLFVGIGLGGAVRGTPVDVAWGLAFATALAMPMWTWAAVREHRSSTGNAAT